MQTIRIAVLGMAASLFLTAVVLAADVTGVWKGEVKLPTGQALPFVARLAQQGTTVTGTLDGIGGAPDVKVVDGKADGDTITFSGVRDINGAPVKFNYTATVVDADTLDFKILRDDGTGPPLGTVAKRSKD